MKKEAMEKCIAQRTAHAMRAAAIRLARERAGEDADPNLAYGCVDWFRYDATSPPRAAETSSHPRLRGPLTGEAARRRVIE